jgi:hypothetical protein
MRTKGLPGRGGGIRGRLQFQQLANFTWWNWWAL